ncbi:TolC family outer membrane protein [Novosphingobium sp.]|uniref:TolC family outer membrane protein n=1 Tax=Novosphingobium sp. TaxID=1874826 RepID=UPI001DCE2DBD|nr:TolC family outer membrane protein [Novosphingobium sp.]MBX9665113.1 TolC family outer membrane protein [Novosphingobium sp.]
MLAAHPGGIEKIEKEALVPHRLARLPLTALATSLAAGMALAACPARAADPVTAPAPVLRLPYVLEGLDGPDLVTVSGPGLGQAVPPPPPLQPPSPPIRPEAPAVIRLALARPLLPAPFAPAILTDLVPSLSGPDLVPVRKPILPQGPMPDGSTLAARLADEAGAIPAAAAELPALDPAQPAVAEAPPEPHTVLSKLDGPGPLPALRPLAAMVGPDAPLPPAAAEPDEPDPAPATPAPATAEGTESLTDAIIASLKGNPEIQISLAQQDDARYAVNEARAAYLPRIDVTGAWGREFARNIPQAATQRFRSEATISLNQNLWDFGVTINDIKRARASYRSAQWGTRERIEAISYDIANAYLGVLLQQNLVALAEDEIASVKKILRIVTVQKDLGLTTPADVERAQTRLDNVRSQLLDRQSALEQARNAYKRLTDHMPLRAAEVPAAGAALPESADVAVDLIDTRSPRLAQAVEDRRSLDKQYDSQADTALPRLGLTIASDYRQDVLGATGRAIDARAMVTFSYRLYNGGAATATKRRIAARLRQADYELDRRRREVEQDIRVDYASLGAAREKIATIEAEISSAQRVADLYKQQFRGGRRTVFDLLDAEQLLFAAKAKQTANLIALRAAEYRVLQKLGGLFDLVSGGQPLPDLVQPAPGSED